jgi:hypothetical protein
LHRDRVDSRSTLSRSYDRNRDNSQSRGWNDTNRGRSYDSRRGGDQWRGSSRSASYGRGGSYNRQPYHAHGRVSRILPYGGGFRVWIGSAPYPFFVPRAYFRADRFRIGVDIALGGYYNPLGYYDYYDGYNGRSYDNRAYSAGVLRGTVESVDYRRDTFVIRNEASGSFVTVEMRDRRRDVRPGDYVEISGDWARSGVFLAYGVDLLDDQYRR